MALSYPQGRLWRLATLLALATLLWAAFPACAQEGKPASPIMVPNPAADLWRAVRQREGPNSGLTQARGVQTGELIDSSGEDFRIFRRHKLIRPAAILLAVAFGSIMLFYLVRGSILIPGGRSGKRVKRFAELDRVAHWLAAILFIFLALTGLTLMFGRFVVLPLFGSEAFGVIASASKDAHNLFGPLFLVALAFLFIRFAAKNLLTRNDLKWMIRGGGLIGKEHVSSGYFNAGEKVWFWAVIVLGTVLCASGLILDFPIFGLEREVMQITLIVHAIAATLFTAGSFAHIYIGTIGSEGSLDSMTTGYVDENWAEHHHDLWLAEVKAGVKEGTGGPAAADPDPAASAHLQASPDKA